MRTADSNMVYTSADPAVADLHCQLLAPTVVASVWAPTPAERRAIAAGANVALTIFSAQVPPVALGVTFAQGVDEDAPDVRERLAVLADQRGKADA